MALYHRSRAWLLAHLGDRDRAASVIEYALLIALIAMVCLVAVQVLGLDTSSQFSEGASIVDAAG